MTDAAGPAPSGEVPSSPERRKAGRRIADTEDYPGEPKRFRTRRAADRAANEQVLMTPEKALHVLRLMVGSAEMYGKARDAGRHTPAHLIPDPVQGGKILAKVIPPLAALRDELVALRASLASRPAPRVADLAGMLDGRITAYLSGGGLWNPELADHDAVRDLLIDARAAFAQVARERDDAVKVAEEETIRFGLAQALDDNKALLARCMQAESALATAEKERGQEEAAGDLHRNLNGATYLALHGERHGDWSKMPAEVAALKESLATAQAETAALREAVTDASPYREAQWSIIDPDRDPVEAYREMLSHGSGNIHCVWLRDHPLSVGEFPRPEHAVLLCITGNGPKSEANAKAIIALWTAARALLSRPATEETP
jgi:hypothetical protein